VRRLVQSHSPSKDGVEDRPKGRPEDAPKPQDNLEPMGRAVAEPMEPDKAGEGRTFVPGHMPADEEPGKVRDQGRSNVREESLVKVAPKRLEKGGGKDSLNRSGGEQYLSSGVEMGASVPDEQAKVARFERSQRHWSIHPLVAARATANYRAGIAGVDSFLDRYRQMLDRGLSCRLYVRHRLLNFGLRVNRLYRRLPYDRVLEAVAEDAVKRVGPDTGPDRLARAARIALELAGRVTPETDEQWICRRTDEIRRRLRPRRAATGAECPGSCTGHTSHSRDGWTGSAATATATATRCSWRSLGSCGSSLPEASSPGSSPTSGSTSSRSARQGTASGNPGRAGTVPQVGPRSARTGTVPLRRARRQRAVPGFPALDCDPAWHTMTAMETVCGPTEIIRRYADAANIAGRTKVP